MSFGRPTLPIRTLMAAPVIAVTVLVAAAGDQTPSSQAADIGQLSSQLSHEQARQHALSESVANLSQTIGALDSQIALVQSREAAVQADLETDRAQLARIQMLLTREQRLIKVLKTRLAQSRAILAKQLVSRYEGDKPDVMSVVLEAHGFTDLLEKLNFLARAEQEQQSAIKATAQAKAQADAAERKLA